MKLLTVTVPCYNSQDYMENCVNSLLTGGDRVEIILIDDGSKDRTGEIADRLAAEHPGIVKAIHQPNGGHGAGINAGLRSATGRYFKPVDSDDTLSADFPSFLDTLESLDAEGGVDLVVTNYYYVHSDGVGDKSINFSNVLPEGEIFSWKQTKTFRPEQLLMIHACTFRTDFLRQAAVELPEHLFYEDNYYVYANLRDTERMFYLNMDLYRYWIGRAGQSVQEDVMTRRYAHQLKATELCLTQFHLDDVEHGRHKRYCKHTLFLMLGISGVYARLNGSEQAEQDWKDLWKTYKDYDPKWERHFHRFTPLCLLCIPGKPGRGLVRGVYKLAHKIVRFN